MYIHWAQVSFKNVETRKLISRNQLPVNALNKICIDRQQLEWNADDSTESNRLIVVDLPLLVQRTPVLLSLLEIFEIESIVGL